MPFLYLTYSKGMQSGIYKITSILFPDRIYVGSAKNLRVREREHYRHLRKGKHANPILQNHANKYGIADLIFTVIERTDQLIIREQYYIDTLNPFFNICRKAGNTQGRPQSEETRRKRSIALKGREISNNQKHLIRMAMRNRNTVLRSIREYALITPYIGLTANRANLHAYQCTVCHEVIRSTQDGLLKRTTHHCIKPTPKPKTIKIKVSKPRQWVKARSDSRTGHIGITFDTRANKFRARLKIGRKLLHIGNFERIEDAIAARAHYVHTHNIPHRLGNTPTQE